MASIANTKTLITVKTDKSLKRAVDKLIDEIGIPLGTLINSFLRQIVRDKEVSFSISYKPNIYLRTTIEEGLKEYREGKLPEAHSVGELEKELLS